MSISFPSSRPRRTFAALGAVVVLAVAAAGCGSSSGSSTSSASAAATATPSPGAPAQGAPGGRPGFKQATGTAATKAKAAALAKYPGTAQRVFQLPDGSYAVGVQQTNGTMVRVLVSKDFAVTGTQTGGPRGGGPPASGAATPTQ
jgi:hypothetical protein